MHRLGQSELRLKSFLEDRFMGARPIGNVALSSTIAYLGGLLILAFQLDTFLPIFTNISFQLFFTVLLILGIVMFFLPLNSVHRKMQSEKRNHQKELGKMFLSIKQRGQAYADKNSGSKEDVQSSITELVRLKEFEITERRLAGTPTWPFDIQLLTKLITIILSVTTGLFARVIASLLHI
jgi:ABC-type multidrug transport system fused ATPase/permease subunit